MPRSGRQRWTVQGVVDRSGLVDPPERLSVTLIDLDPLEHDLIATGSTDPEGRFEFTFGLADFNLQPLEREQWPDLWIVIQRDPDDRGSILYSRGFPRCAWENHTLTVSIGPDELSDDAESREIPAHSGRPVTRTRLTRSRLERWPRTVAEGLAEVTDLQDVGIPQRVVVGHTLTATIEHLLCRTGDWSTRWCSLVSFHDLESVAYDPVDDTIIVHPRCRTMSTAATEVLIARALTAKVQFHLVPGLLDRLGSAGEQLWSELDALDRLSCSSDGDRRQRFEELAAPVLVESELTRIACALDDHAARLDAQFRSGHPSVAVPLVEPSVATRLLQAVALRFNLGYRHVDTVLQAIRGRAATAASPSLPGWLIEPVDR